MGHEYGMEVIKAGEKAEDPYSVVSAFLKQYDTAKIVFIVDTHCGDNGRFVYTGRKPTKYKMCSLKEVAHIITCILQRLICAQILRDCAPPDIFQYLSDESSAPQHTHRSLILNLACGASVTHTVARHLLLEGSVCFDMQHDLYTVTLWLMYLQTLC